MATLTGCAYSDFGTAGLVVGILDLVIRAHKYSNGLARTYRNHCHSLKNLRMASDNRNAELPLLQRFAWGMTDKELEDYTPKSQEEQNFIQKVLRIRHSDISAIKEMAWVYRPTIASQRK